MPDPRERICVLTGRMPWSPFNERESCPSRIHGHMTRDRAEQLVSQERAEWVTSSYTDQKGRQRLCDASPLLLSIAYF